jgi:oligosaccharide repeat unit polymerase
MWLALVIGIEMARASWQPLTARSERVIRGWRAAAISDRPDSDQLLATLGILVALYLVAVFLYFGKPGQFLNFLSLQSTADKAKFRHDFGPEGGYVYQTLISSVAPFLSFVLVLKGVVSRKRHLSAIGLLIGAAAFAGKVVTYAKSPWLVFVLQIIIVVQATRSLKFGLGRFLVISIVILLGVVLAAVIALPQLDYADLVEWLTYRFFQVNNEVIYQTFYVYPEYLPHTWGMNIGLIHALFGSGDLVSAHTRVASFFGSEGATFDSFFIGDAWVDFSYGGVIIMSLAVGFVVKSVDIFVMSLGKTPLSLALLGSGMYGLFQLELTSAFTAFFSGGLVLIPLLASASAGLINDLSGRSRGRGANPAPEGR